MSKIFFDELNIRKPEINLNVGSGTHTYQTATTMTKLESVLDDIKPTMVMLYGDVNATLAGALVCAKRQIPISHVESGLRSSDLSMPEEINRIITDHIAKLLFCPSNHSKKILSYEGINKGVYVVGDVMYDIFNQNVDNINDDDIADYVLLTMHRAENTQLEKIELRLEQLSKIKHNIIYPIHPRTKKMIKQFKITVPTNIKIIDPLGWLDLMNVAKKSLYIITDSGGLQKEALWLKKYCLTIRNETEWIETIQQGVNQIIKIDDKIVDPPINKKGDFHNPYGDGSASIKIASTILNYFN